MKVSFLKRALIDQLRETEFWRLQDPALPAEFLKELENAVRDIIMAPNGHILVSETHGLRRYYEKRFHTHIIYQHIPAEDSIRIVRIYNARMRPIRFD